MAILVVVEQNVDQRGDGTDAAKVEGCDAKGPGGGERSVKSHLCVSNNSVAASGKGINCTAKEVVRTVQW